MKKISQLISVLLIVLIIVVMRSTAPTAAAVGYGSNSKFLAPIAEPVTGSIPISNRTQLEAIKNNLNANYHLTADIDLSGAEWIPIGDSHASSFRGVLDGQGYVIKNLKVSGNYNNAGLFGYSSGTVKNLGMEGVDINTYSSDGRSYAGAICGSKNALPNSMPIYNCYSSGSISVSSSSSSNAGGLCGLIFNADLVATCRIFYCYNTGTVSASYTASNGFAAAGGIFGVVGENLYIPIENCFNSGDISAMSSDDAYVGGISGYAVGHYSKCYNTGMITATSSSSTSRVLVGGIGGLSADGSVKNSYNTGKISAISLSEIYAGGIYGSDRTGQTINYGSNIENCYNIGEVSSSNSSPYVGGIRGEAHNGSDGDVRNAYCLDLYNSSDGTQLSPAEMKNKTYLVGFDCPGIWDLSPSINNGYPYLRSLLFSDSGNSVNLPSDNTPFTIISFSPALGEMDVACNARIEITFNRPISLYLQYGVTLIKQVSSSETDIKVSYDGSVLQITPNKALEENTWYRIRIKPNAIASGNEYFEGLLEYDDFYFKTGAAQSSAVYYLNDAGWTNVIRYDNPLDWYLTNNSSTVYNVVLAEMAMAFSTSVYDSQCIEDSLVSHGFEKPLPLPYNEQIAFNYDRPIFALSKKTASNGDTVVAVVIRGSNSTADWLADFGVGTEDTHIGFRDGAKAIHDILSDYISSTQNNSKITYFITGHSYGAALANLLSKKLTDDGIDQNRIFTYTFATPNVANQRNHADWNPHGMYSNIFNICNTADLVPNLPALPSGALSEWGKYGNTYFFSSGDLLPTSAHAGITYLEWSRKRVYPDDTKNNARSYNLDSASEWAYDGIISAATKGFVPADLQNNYKNVITRQEFCRMAIKWVEYATGKNIDSVLADRGVSRDSNAFTDTNDPDILAAFALGITNGTGNNQFSPNGQFTREQAAAMIMNTCKAIGADTGNTLPSGFSDINLASVWAVEGINFVRAYSIMQGTGNNDFSPKATYTREQSIITFDNIVPDSLAYIGSASIPLQEQTPKSADIVTFTLRTPKWDTSYNGIDIFQIGFYAKSEQVISETGVVCKNSNGAVIKSYGGAVSSIDTEYFKSRADSFYTLYENGKNTGNLVPGETYYWIGYAICNGVRYETDVMSFVFSMDGTRYKLT